MNTVRTMAKNIFMLAIAQIAIGILSFVLIVFMARYLGDIGFGKYTFALAFCGLFGIFADLGLSVLTVREVARDKDIASKYFSNITAIKFVLSIVTFGLIFIVLNLMDYPWDTTVVVYIIGLSLIFNSFAQFLKSIFRAFEKMEYETATTVAERLIVVSLGIVILTLGYGLIGLASVVLVGSIINVLLNLFIIMLKKFVKPKIELNLSFCKHLIKNSLPFGLSMFFTSIYFGIDCVMLSAMKGDAVLGWYNAAYKLIFVLMFIPTAFVGSFFPIISKFYVSSKNSSRITYEKSFKYLLIIGLPIPVGTTILADRIILLIYGKEFIQSIIALQILIWVALIMFLTYLLGNALGAINRQKIVLSVTGVSAVVNVCLNLLLIPKFSYVGASVATVVTEGVVFILSFHFISKHLYRILLHKYIAKPLLASLIMGALILYLKEANLLLLISVAIFAYFVTLYFTRAISQEDMDLFKQVIRKRAVSLREL